MKVVNSVEFTIRVGYIESINKYLIPVGKGKVAMSPECKAFKQNVKNQLFRSGVKINGDLKSWFTLSCVVVFKTCFNRRDTNNCIKMLVDAVCEYFGLNDNKIFNEQYTKMWNKGSDYEYIKCKLTLYDADEKDFLVKP